MGVCLPLMLAALIIVLGSNPIALLMKGLLLVLLTIVPMAAYDRLRARRKSISEGEAFKTPRRGVVFRAGLKSHDPNSTVIKVLDILKPEYCAFIGTEKTFEAGVSKRIVEAAGLKPGLHKEKIIDPTDIKDSKRGTADLIEWMMSLGLSEQDIVVDLTGGTAVMSVATYMAAAENGIDAQCIYSEYRDNRPVDGTQKALMIKQV